MKITVKQIVQILKQFYLLINRLSWVEKIILLVFSIAFIRAVYITIINFVKQLLDYIFANYQIIITIVFGILGIIIFGLGLYLYIVRVRGKDQQNILEESYLDDDIHENINIYSEGNYNENINGDYIEIQGDYISINQNFSEFATELRELVNHLKNQGYSEEEAKTQVASELAEEARKKPQVRKKLFTWKKSFGVKAAKTNDETEVAKEAVRSATSYSYTSSKDFTEVVSGYYKNLDELLQARKWQEADLETAKIIYLIAQKELPNTSPYKTYLQNHFDAEHIKVLPRKDLNNINKLWLKYSNGRFGFSVQKRIWKEIIGRHDRNYMTYNKYEIKKNFADQVGWRNADECIYYSDIYYSNVAPPGHLPIRLMLLSGKSERCNIDFERLEVIVGRIYGRI
ncbi:GUN4 domain-containing protein [Sphaerospermopsis aphanizomenoides BCCUSP55]|uniref:GUN4 domain-containing protein n=1 Tax=Sphaerospermopsis aphanizomenoides TaxID=459663 RepID=UPI00190339AE|nr:GUN4 domain-containing protein [Sphaerospermopsis aphanizomenoides]MBK1988105.1 GUN4 domain-containing protein [Sphaerospermopsis aphanizomenoides BCCUSP55]